MRAFSLTVLFVLLLAMCGLCAVQWWRESQIREIAVALRSELAVTAAESDQLNDRAKAADAEIVRLNGAITELRANSVSKQDMETATQSTEQLKTKLTTQNEAILHQNQALLQQNEAMQKANATIRQLVAERDTLAKKSNEITAKYNALMKNKAVQ